MPICVLKYGQGTSDRAKSPRHSQGRKGSLLRALVRFLHPDRLSVHPIVEHWRLVLAVWPGVIDFFHRQLSKAVKNRYLSKEDDVRYYHKLLAQYFHEHAEGKHDKFHFTGHDARGFGELPYHRLMSGSRDVAEELLTDFTFLMGKARTGLVMEILSDYEMLDEQ